MVNRRDGIADLVKALDFGLNWQVAFVISDAIDLGMTETTSECRRARGRGICPHGLGR
jgi:hypothetical protein